MTEAGVHERAIEVFAHYYRELEAGGTGLIAESDIEPLDQLPRADALQVDRAAAREALAQTAVIKLNGGLGTSMGMDRAKSLLPVRPGLSFLDIIVRQVLATRERYDARLPLVFMNSFRTRDDTLAALERYEDLAVGDLPLDFLQNREPKLLADTLEPVDWPADPSLEWCPPGHGDLYTALEVSGVLEALLEAGIRYATVSNSDNLGAAPDPALAGWFAASGAPFAAEVCSRTVRDVKGGYHVRRVSDGRLVLRESAQTRDEDLSLAHDITRHRFFNTNNLWFDLVQLRETLLARDGVLGLPLIRNVKNVDPADGTSPKVVQLETAMGAAIEVFEGATAVEVPRSRFLPVKTTNDLALLRSDVYAVDPDDHTVRAVADPPSVDLDRAFYSTMADFDRRLPHPLGLREAAALTVRGDWTFAADVQVRGAVELEGDGSPREVESGVLES